MSDEKKYFEIKPEQLKDIMEIGYAMIRNGNGFQMVTKKDLLVYEKDVEEILKKHKAEAQSDDES